MAGHCPPPDPLHLQLQSVRNAAGSQLLTGSLDHVGSWSPFLRSMGAATLASAFASASLLSVEVTLWWRTYHLVLEVTLQAWRQEWLLAKSGPFLWG